MKPVRIKNVKDTTENWQLLNPVLLNGELGFEVKSDGMLAIKIGDGITAWNDLPYVTTQSVEQANTKENKDLRLLLSNSQMIDDELGTTKKSSKFTANPSTGELKAPVFVGVFEGDLIGNAATASIANNAETAMTANKLSNTSAVGSVNVPVYFTSEGIPSPCEIEEKIASTTNLGSIKVGNNLTIEEDGTLNAENSYTLPTASASTLGGVKVGSGLSISGGVLKTNTNITYGTTDLTDGVSSLATGTIYFVYE